MCRTYDVNAEELIRSSDFGIEHYTDFWIVRGGPIP
jgi:hypothetical protein